LDIVHYLEPYKGNKMTIPGITLEESLGSTVSYFKGDSDWLRNFACNVVVIGVPESRNGAGNRQSADAPDILRKWLYSFRSLGSDIRIGDAGNVLGSGLNDRYQALREVVAFFLNHKSTIVILGGTQDITLPAFQALAGSMSGINLAVGDAMLDVDVNSDDFSSRSWLSHLIGTKNPLLNDVTVFGQQSYLVSEGQEQFMRSRFYDIVRLGDIRGDDLERTEVIMRDAHMVSLDFRMISGQPQFDENVMSPHGLENQEACRICRYAGISDKVKVFGLFEVAVSDNQTGENTLLAAQMIWHFLEGVAGRYLDYPVRELNSYKQYIIPADGVDEGLKFYRNPVNDRWWMEVPSRDEATVMACSRDDYRKALRKELPEKWWRFFLKHSQSEPE
jgi:formiminoglutamase